MHQDRQTETPLVGTGNYAPAVQQQRVFPRKLADEGGQPNLSWRRRRTLGRSRHLQSRSNVPPLHCNLLAGVSPPGGWYGTGTGVLRQSAPV